MKKLCKFPTLAYEARGKKKEKKILKANKCSRFTQVIVRRNECGLSFVLNLGGH